MKNFRVLTFCLLLIFSVFLLGGCSNNRPVLSSESTVNQNDSTYYNVSFEEGINITSTYPLKKANKQKVKAGVLLKIAIDSNSNIKNLEATDGNTYYFDAITNKVITGVKVNGLEISVDKLDTPITVTSDMYISLVSSNLSLHSVLVCHNHNEINSLTTTYNKFNKNKNFRNSLISEDNKIIENNEIYYLTFDEKFSILQSNVSSKIKVSANELNLTIEATYEAKETAIAFVYKDANNHTFITQPYKTNKYSLSKKNNLVNTYILADGSNKAININLAKYYLPQ